MPCFDPRKGWASKEVNPSGKRSTTFDVTKALEEEPRTLACGQCRGCRLERSRQWAVRIMHEASLYEDNVFVTLTYDDDHLPHRGTLDVVDFQLFMKKLRFHFSEEVFGPPTKRNVKSKPRRVYRKIRFFHCGEYGEKFSRPHYHACLFNIDFSDKVEIEKAPSGERQYESATLTKLWKNGRATIGSLTFSSAAYAARYITKKVTGSAKYDHYGMVDPETGEIFEMKPEYVTMSRRPGIGKPWFEKYLKDVYPNDQVIVRGVPCKPPKAYDKYLEATCPETFKDVKDEREFLAFMGKENVSPDRLAAKKYIQEQRFTQLKREFENDSKGIHRLRR